MNGHCCSCESELGGTWNIWVSLSCRLPGLEFLGEHSFYSAVPVGTQTVFRQDFVLAPIPLYC